MFPSFAQQHLVLYGLLTWLALSGLVSAVAAYTIHKIDESEQLALRQEYEKWYTRQMAKKYPPSLTEDEGAELTASNWR